MWARAIAIRPVPHYAVLERVAVEQAARDIALAEDEGEGRELEQLHLSFQESQPALADYVMQVLGNQLDETAIALGFFLSLTVWRAFERIFGSELASVTEEEIQATAGAIETEEELRRDQGEEPMDWEEIVALEQPALFAFVNEQVDAALASEEREIDVDDVHLVFRMIVLLSLCLSHAIKRHGGGAELLA